MTILNLHAKISSCKDSLQQRGVSSSSYTHDDKNISHSICNNETPPSCLGLIEFPPRANSLSPSKKRKLELSCYPAVLNSKLVKSNLKYEEDGQSSLSNECLTSQSGHGREEAFVNFVVSSNSGSLSSENSVRSRSISQCSSSSSLSMSRRQHVSRSLTRGGAHSTSPCCLNKNSNLGYQSSYSSYSSAFNYRKVPSSTYCDSRLYRSSRTDNDSDRGASWNRSRSDKYNQTYLHSPRSYRSKRRNNHSKPLSSYDHVNRHCSRSRYSSNHRLAILDSYDTGAIRSSSNFPVCSTSYSISNSAMRSTMSHSEYSEPVPFTNFVLNTPTKINKVTIPPLSESSFSFAPVCTSSCRRWYSDLPLEFWERSIECKKAKSEHMDRLDNLGVNREQLVLLTTLANEDVVLEKNMFPYDTPAGIEHYTLWSVRDLKHSEIVSFVDSWLDRYMPRSRRWQYDDNSGERSVDLFHVHVFIETVPYSYVPQRNKIHIPEHIRVENSVKQLPCDFERL